MKVDTILKAKGGRVITSSPDALIINVVELMRQESIGVLIICRSNRHLLGQISEKNIVHLLSTHGEKLMQLAAHHVMTPINKTCSPKDDLKQVMRTMTNLRLRHMPIIDGDRLCGVISLGDIVKHIVSEMEMEVSVLRDMCLASGHGSVIPNRLHEHT